MHVHRSPLAVALAVTVKQRRAELNMSSEDLADAMGVPPEIVTDIEGSTPNDSLYSKGTLMLLSLALRLPENALVEYSHNPSETAPARKPEAEPASESEPTAVPKPVSAPEPEPKSKETDVKPTEDTKKDLQESVQPQPTRKAIVLPPMFARRTPTITETAPITPNDNDDDQQKVYIGLEAIPQGDLVYKQSRSKPKLPKPETPRSPFIPHHGIEPRRNIQLGPTNRSKDLLRDLESPRKQPLHSNEKQDVSEEITTAAGTDSETAAAVTEVAVSQAPESAGKIYVQPPLATRKRYVPALASRLPFSDIQRETGILRIDQLMNSELIQKDLPNSEPNAKDD
ncbi:MAG: hypothetical protein EKK48_02590 [Candidatus Melainabacteria bacterium]|nr:MAG: hypothetical protein EKK48_02590 [Candidatus Melainabacteria bacterium]